MLKLSVCFAAEDLSQSPTKKDSPKSETTQLYANDPVVPTTPTKTDSTPPSTPVDPPTPATPTVKVNPPEINGETTPDGKPSSPEPSAPQAANEKASINNAQTNNKNVEELYDIPIGK